MIQSAHASLQGYAAQEAKATYRLTLRSTDGANFNSAIQFHPSFENQALLPSDASYQVAVESFVLWNSDPAQLNVPVFITATDTSVANTYDSHTGGRSRVLLTTSVGAGMNGFNLHVTKDTIGIPCASLGLFTNRTLTLQMQTLSGAAFTNEGYFGTDAGAGQRMYGEWCISLVVYPM
jgi:hypothetical protein